ncbi:MAG: hypothetical protein GKR90_11105 [Pseudomonadales bacterium]|nr:hypothetical protein [Pseudomonadales bacterium]
MILEMYVPILAAVVCLLCAIFSSIGARQKERNELGWFLIGMSTGPFGLLVYAMPSMVPIASLGTNKKTPEYLPKSGAPMWVSFVGFGVFAAVLVTLLQAGGALEASSFPGTIMELVEYVRTGEFLPI